MKARIVRSVSGWPDVSIPLIFAQSCGHVVEVLKLSAKAEIFIPLVFEKSRYAAVAILGVMKVSLNF